jgi:galactokinase/mevalonate kinase-like predicted kinase
MTTHLHTMNASFDDATAALMRRDYTSFDQAMARFWEARRAAQQVTQGEPVTAEQAAGRIS